MATLQVEQERREQARREAVEKQREEVEKQIGGGDIEFKDKAYGVAMTLHGGGIAIRPGPWRRCEGPEIFGIKTAHRRDSGRGC
jgi:hypothetical protein